MIKKYVESITFNPKEIKWALIKIEKILNEKSVKYDEKNLEKLVVENFIDAINEYLQRYADKIGMAIAKELFEAR